MHHLDKFFDWAVSLVIRGLFALNVKGYARLIEALNKHLLGPRVMSAYGVWLTENWSDATFRFSVLGSYGRDIPNVLYELGPGTIFLDIGANTGLFSFVAEKNKNILACYCFEPNPFVFEMLNENKRLNNSGAYLLNFGIGAHNETVGFKFDIAHTGKGRIVEDEKPTQTIKIRDYRAFDEIFERHKAHAFFCKIDVEGYELIVIEQLQKSKIYKYLDGVVVEVDERRLKESEVEKIKTILISGGLGCVRRIGRGEHYDLLFLRDMRSNR